MDRDLTEKAGKQTKGLNIIVTCLAQDTTAFENKKNLCMLLGIPETETLTMELRNKDKQPFDFFHDAIENWKGRIPKATFRIFEEALKGEDEDDEVAIKKYSNVLTKIRTKLVKVGWLEQEHEHLGETPTSRNNQSNETKAESSKTNGPKNLTTKTELTGRLILKISKLLADQSTAIDSKESLCVMLDLSSGKVKSLVQNHGKIPINFFREACILYREEKLDASLEGIVEALRDLDLKSTADAVYALRLNPQ